MAQVPRCLHLSPDAPRPLRGLSARRLRAAPFLTLTHFLASMGEATRAFTIFDTLTIREMESWFPDQSGILSQLPPTWTAKHAADMMGTIPFQLCWPQLWQCQRSSSPGAAAQVQQMSTPMPKHTQAGNVMSPAEACHVEAAGASGQGLVALCYPCPSPVRLWRVAEARPGVQKLAGRNQWPPSGVAQRVAGWCPPS